MSKNTTRYCRLVSLFISEPKMVASVRFLTASLLLLLCIIAAMIPRNESLSCIPCDATKCKKPKGCRHGYTKDICFCCERCAKGRGKVCGGDWGELGVCAKGLNCLTNRATRRGKCA